MNSTRMCEFFEDDLILRGLDVGLVSRVGVYEADSEEDDDQNYSQLGAGELRINWLSGTEGVAQAKDVSLLDRSFLHGDIVAKLDDPQGQLGIVVDVTLLLDGYH